MTVKNNEVQLSWDLPNIYGTNQHESANISYNLYRNGTLVCCLDEKDTLYRDTTILDGINYTYQLRLKEESDNPYDWSNTVALIQDRSLLNNGIKN